MPEYAESAESCQYPEFMTDPHFVSFVRAAVNAELKRLGPTALSMEIGVAAQTLTDFATGAVDQPRARNWSALEAWGSRKAVFRTEGEPDAEVFDFDPQLQTTTARETRTLPPEVPLSYWLGRLDEAAGILQDAMRRQNIIRKDMRDHLERAVRADSQAIPPLTMAHADGDLAAAKQLEEAAKPAKKKRSNG